MSSTLPILFWHNFQTGEHEKYDVRQFAPGPEFTEVETYQWCQHDENLPHWLDSLVNFWSNKSEETNEFLLEYEGQGYTLSENTASSPTWPGKTPCYTLKVGCVQLAEKSHLANYLLQLLWCPQASLPQIYPNYQSFPKLPPLE